MATKKKQDNKPIYHCEDCAHATPDMKFENLSLEGKPTLLICSFDKWKKLFKEPACKKHFQPKEEPKVKSDEPSFDNVKLNNNQYSLF